MLSRIEYLARKFFEEILPYNVIYNYRPDWLMNPKTQQNLELDIYFPDLNIAIEINGILHELPYQIYKDRLKRKLCKENDVSLFTAENTNDFKNIAQKILGCKINIPKGLEWNLKTYKPKKLKQISKIYKDFKKRRRLEIIHQRQTRKRNKMYKKKYGISPSRLKLYERLQREETERNRKQMYG